MSVSEARDAANKAQAAYHLARRKRERDPSLVSESEVERLKQEADAAYEKLGEALTGES